MRDVLVALGTRSEMVKLAPVIRTLRDEYAKKINTRWIHTGQNPDVVWQTGALFGLTPDRQVKLKVESEQLKDLSWEISNAMATELDGMAPDLLIVQGDSISSVLASQQAFIRRIPIVHIEGGLRSYEGHADAVRESNRRMLSALASFHCVTNSAAAYTLRAEGFPAYEIGVTGNTIVDALNIVQANGVLRHDKLCVHKHVSLSGAKVLVAINALTKWAGALTNIGFAIANLAHDFPGLRFTVAVYPHTVAHNGINSVLSCLKNVELRDPMPYLEFIRLVQESDIVLADSSDIQDESISLGKLVLIMQEAPRSEMKAVIPDHRFIGVTSSSIYRGVQSVLGDAKTYQGLIGAPNPFGDGHASQRIGRLISNWARNSVLTPHAFDPFDNRPRSLQ